MTDAFRALALVIPIALIIPALLPSRQKTTY